MNMRRRRRQLPAALQKPNSTLLFILSSLSRSPRSRTLKKPPPRPPEKKKKKGDGSLAHLDASEAEALSRDLLPAGANAPIPLPEGLYEVGREQPAELVLPVPTVSARHARLTVGPSAVAVADLGSTNGTYLDGVALEPMAEVAMGLGQEVVFGDQHLARYRLDSE